MRAQGWARAILAVVPLLVVVGCDDGNVVESGSVANPTIFSDAPVIVTFEVNEGDRFKVLLTEPDDIQIAWRLSAGEDAPDIPNGRIVRETGVNEGWSWSLDPADFEFADATIEVCDGVPTDVESGALTGDRYCPWSARVVAVDPAT